MVASLDCSGTISVGETQAEARRGTVGEASPEYEALPSGRAPRQVKTMQRNDSG